MTTLPTLLAELRRRVASARKNTPKTHEAGEGITSLPTVMADELLAHIDALEKRCGKLDSLLTELYALVVGECPSLLNEDSGGSERLDTEICAALAEQGEPK